MAQPEQDNDPYARQRDYLTRRAQAYRAAFEGPGGKLVLADLARFCRATQSTFHPDQRMSDVLVGRQEVWLRLQEHLQLTDDELWELRKG